MNESINALFNPSGVAIIGASRSESSIGHGIVQNLLDGEFKGEIFPVNPKAEEILGLKCFSRVNEIEKKVDLAIIVIPRDKVKKVMEECAEKGVKAVIVISAGFKEVDEKGKALEKELVSIAKENNMSLLGPNCLGVINTDPKVKLNGTFAKRIPNRGNISFISQSGAVGVYALEYADRHKINFAKFASLGNKALSNENDILKHFLKDDQTDVILAYLEDFQNPKEFFELANCLVQKDKPNPLVVLKSGGSESGKRAAASHTGAMSESDEVLDHLFEQFGIIRVNNLENLFYISQIFSVLQKPIGNRLCILSNAGGPGIITADAAEKAGLKVPALSDALQKKLSKNLPDTVSLNNPIDLVGDATSERYEKALENLMDSDEFDILLVLCTPQIITNLEKIAKTVGNFAENAKEKGKLILAVFADFEPNSKTEAILSDCGIPFYRFGKNAIDACAEVIHYYKLKKIIKDNKKVQFEVKKDNAERLLKEAKSRKNKFLTEPEAYQIFKDYGLKIASHRFVENKEDLKKAAADIGYPLVAKVVSEQVIHKSDVEGVVTNIQNEENLIQAYDQIYEKVKEKKEKVSIKGILLQKMVQEGVELIIGAQYNEKYGHLLMFGLGGIFVEVLRDVTFRKAPISKSEAIAMIEGIKSQKIMEGIRGMPALDKDNLADFLLRISQLVCDFPQIKEIDLNPVFGLKDGAVIADARLIVR